MTKVQNKEEALPVQQVLHVEQAEGEPQELRKIPQKLLENRQLPVRRWRRTTSAVQLLIQERDQPQDPLATRRVPLGGQIACQAPRLGQLLLQLRPLRPFMSHHRQPVL